MTSTIQRQLGNDWDKINPDIQARFIHEPKLHERRVYEGTMTTIKRSFMGYVFARLTSVIGNPLTPFKGRNVPMEVTLFKCEKTDGVCWQRTYYHPD